MKHNPGKLQRGDEGEEAWKHIMEKCAKICTRTVTCSMLYIKARNSTIAHIGLRADANESLSDATNPYSFPPLSPNPISPESSKGQREDAAQRSAGGFCCCCRCRCCCRCWVLPFLPWLKLVFWSACNTELYRDPNKYVVHTVPVHCTSCNFSYILFNWP